MPYVLLHKQDRTIYSCMLINIYKLPYYGAKYWDSRNEADSEMMNFLVSQGETNPEGWELLEVEEHRLKVFNVKLSNQPSRRVRLEEDGRAVGYSKE